LQPVADAEAATVVVRRPTRPSRSVPATPAGPPGAVNRTSAWRAM